MEIAATAVGVVGTVFGGWLVTHPRQARNMLYGTVHQVKILKGSATEESWEVSAYTEPPHPNPPKVVSREGTLMRIASAIGKEGKHNVLLLGKKGTGKSAVVEEFARRLAASDYPLLKDRQIRWLNNPKITGEEGLSAIVQSAGGDTPHSRLEDLLKALKRYPQKYILVIDEFQQIATTNTFKKFLADMANGSLPPIIGITTDEEYTREVKPSQSSAEQRRWEKIELVEFTRNETIGVLGKVAKSQYPDSPLDDKTIWAIVTLAHQYLRNAPDPLDPTQKGTQPDVSVSLLGEFMGYCTTKSIDPDLKQLITYFTTTREFSSQAEVAGYLRDQTLIDKQADCAFEECFQRCQSQNKGGIGFDRGKEELISHFSRKQPNDLVVCGDSPWLFAKILESAIEALEETNPSLAFYTLDFLQFVQYAEDSTTSDNLLTQLDSTLTKDAEDEKKPVLILSEKDLLALLSLLFPSRQGVLPSNVEEEAALRVTRDLGLPSSIVRAAKNVLTSQTPHFDPVPKWAKNPSRPVERLLREIKRRKVSFVGFCPRSETKHLQCFRDAEGATLHQLPLKSSEVLDCLTSWGQRLNQTYSFEEGLVQVAYHLALHFYPEQPNPDTAMQLIELTMQTVSTLKSSTAKPTLITIDDLIQTLSEELNKPRVVVESVAVQAAIWKADLVPAIVPFQQQQTPLSRRQKQALRLLKSGSTPVVYVWKSSPLRTELFLKTFEKAPQGWHLHQLDIGAIQQSGASDPVVVKSLEASFEKLTGTNNKIALWVDHCPLLENPELKQKLQTLINTKRVILFYGCEPTHFAFRPTQDNTRTKEKLSSGWSAGNLFSQLTGVSNISKALSSVARSVQETAPEEQKETPPLTL